MSELKPFPDREKYGGKEGRADAIAKITDGWQALSEMWLYEQARADAWEARARLAVEALKDAHMHLSDCHWCMDDDDAISGVVHCARRTADALALIGPLPKEQQT